MDFHFPGQVLGIDFDTRIFKEHKVADRKVIYADVMDKDFWGKIDLSGISMAFLNLPDFDKNLF